MNDRKPFIAVNASPAMSGHFATLYVWSHLEGEIWFPEPENTGFGRYATWQEANVEGEQWAKEIGVEFHPCTQEKIDKIHRLDETKADRILRIKELREQGMKLRDAIQTAHREFGV